MNKEDKYNGMYPKSKKRIIKEIKERISRKIGSNLVIGTLAVYFKTIDQIPGYYKPNEKCVIPGFISEGKNFFPDLGIKYVENSLELSYNGPHLYSRSDVKEISRAWQGFWIDPEITAKSLFGFLKIDKKEHILSKEKYEGKEYYCLCGKPIKLKHNENLDDCDEKKLYDNFVEETGDYIHNLFQYSKRDRINQTLDNSSEKPSAFDISSNPFMGSIERIILSKNDDSKKIVLNFGTYEILCCCNGHKKMEDKINEISNKVNLHFKSTGKSPYNIKIENKGFEQDEFNSIKEYFIRQLDY
ncbi:MAG: hypothetical protein PHV16_01640 [Candidatus Nanoarchaeia archaeon]|nr:hypothetical protein [Candidatus Nanoarchaeia archaeon]